MGLTERYWGFMEVSGPIQVDEYRVGDAFTNESQIHFETKLELQHWLTRALPDKPEGLELSVEYLYPWSRVKLGRKFSWLRESRVFDGGEEWLDVNWWHVPTPAAAIQHKYFPRYVFDLVLESKSGIHAVVEVVSGYPTEPEKRAFCREIGVPLYEIDADAFAPQFASRDMHTYTRRKYKGPERHAAPLVGGGQLPFAQLFRETISGCRP